MIEFGKEICQNFAESSSREWLETNGLGGFASSTICGINTRRYHAILTAAIKPPVLRMALVNQYDETLSDGNSEWPLSSHQWFSSDPKNGLPCVVHPEGYKQITQFELFPWPTWRFESESWKLEKMIFMLYGQNTTITLYRLIEPQNKKIELRVRPLLTGRESHHLQLENKQLKPDAKISEGKAAFEPYPGVTPFYLHHNGKFQSSFFWYKNFYYAIEKERGLDFREDCWSPGEIVFTLEPERPAFLIASTEQKMNTKIETIQSEEKRRRESATKLKSKNTSAPLNILLRSSDQLIVRREKNLKTIIAGYPWFADWGRDTFISIFGLCYATGRFDLAKEIIESFSRYVNHGMIPNHFPDSGEAPQYNTVDASLWFVLAVYRYWKETGDSKFVRDVVWQKCVEILQCYREGTRYNIHLDSDGLIFAGTPGVQLTWMDAKAGDWVVTPRIGKPVEIQALWYNALNSMSEMAQALGETDKASEYKGLSNWCKTSFNRIFWYERGGFLYDVIYGAKKDSALRPNQIFAISLPFELLPLDKAKSVLDVVQKYLLTPYGLRSLSPLHPQYQGRYEGDVRKRDGAYHQGTVWSWLIGPFITAYLKRNHYSPTAKAQVKKWLEPLWNHLSECGLGSISEIFDGDAPHTPRGCIAQAWSVAELLRLLIQELDENP